MLMTLAENGLLPDSGKEKLVWPYSPFIATTDISLILGSYSLIPSPIMCISLWLAVYPVFFSHVRDTYRVEG